MDDHLELILVSGDKQFNYRIVIEELPDGNYAWNVYRGEEKLARKTHKSRRAAVRTVLQFAVEDIGG